MHIINLSIECKTATGDGTKIVALNSDYVVRINTKDCGTFSNAPVKKLIVRHGKECYEVDINRETVDGQTFLQAKLPPIEYTKYVDLGVCGKETDDPTAKPVYTSTSARFDCEQSILSGVAAYKKDPVLTDLSVTENGTTHYAKDVGADGFFKVDVDVPVKHEEIRSVPLTMSSGNQEILPSRDNYTISKVIVEKPLSLVPENIKKGEEIGGVQGNYEPVLKELHVYHSGEYTPKSEGVDADGFSKVTVDVEELILNEEPLSITTNGKHDVSRYAEADVNITAVSETPTVDRLFGAWRFHRSITMPDTSIYWRTSFISNGLAFGRIEVTAVGMYFTDVDSNRILVYDPVNDWKSEQYRTISFVDESFTTSDIFNWLTSAAEYLALVPDQSIIVQNDKPVKITSNKRTVVFPDTNYGAMHTVTVDVQVPPVPIEVSTESEMNNILATVTSGAVGAIYKYTGATGKYKNNTLYIIKEI